MGNSLKDAFEQIHAEEALKERTIKYVFEKTGKRSGFSGIFRSHFKALTAACLCFLFIFIAGDWMYFTPTSEINIDINPSLGLGVNRFNQVVSVSGLNQDGVDLSNQLNLKYINYEQALEEVFNSKVIEDLLAEGNSIVITVTGSDQAQSNQIYAEIEIKSADYENASCRHISQDEARKAHDLGLSYGKYQAYLELKEIDPSFTPEELKGMSMEEIQNLIENLLNTPATEEPLDNPSTLEMKEPIKETTPDSQNNSDNVQNQSPQENSTNSQNSTELENSNPSVNQGSPTTEETGHHGSQAHHGHDH